MLLTKDVMMMWTHANKKYFTNKGYDFSKYGDVFVCNVNDLSHRSDKVVECICDYCGSVHSKSYHRYKSGKEIVSKDACKHCASKKTHEIQLIKYGDENYNVRIASQKLNHYNKELKNDFLNKFHTIAKNKGYFVLPFVYENCKDKVGFICDKHKSNGIQYAGFYDISIRDNNCKLCINEAISNREVFSYDTVKSIIESNGRSKLISKIYTNSQDRNLEVLCYRCQKNTFITSLNKFSNRGHIVCKDCRRELSYGESSPHWKGGITSVRYYLRQCIVQWKIDSLINANFTCDISKQKGGKLHIHHMHKNFKDIVDETFKIVGLDIRSKISDYNQFELDQLANICLSLHYKYGLGVCLSENYHREFHNIYGFFNNTLEQYYEFKEKSTKQELS